jgi:hypothetical protein
MNQRNNIYGYGGENPVSSIDPLGWVLVQVTLPGLGTTYLDDSFYALVQQFISNAAANDGSLIEVLSADRRAAANVAAPGVGVIGGDRTRMRVNHAHQSAEAIIAEAAGGVSRVVGEVDDAIRAVPLVSVTTQHRGAAVIIVSARGDGIR